MQRNYEKWSRLSPLGLLISGFGLSLTGYATARMARGRSWFLQGTLGLICFNAGLSIFAEAAKSRAVYEAEVRTYRLLYEHDHQPDRSQRPSAAAQPPASAQASTEQASTEQASTAAAHASESTD